LKKLLKKHNFYYKKKWGQNFIFDSNLLAKIARAAAIVPGDKVMEIGAGIGTLTRELLTSGAEVIAIEIDPALCVLLEKLMVDEAVVLIQGDVLKLNLTELAARYGWQGDYKVVANLPYYLTTPLLIKLLEEAINSQIMVLMMQKEVAARLKAKPGTKAYGALTLKVQYHACVEILFTVPRDVFQPVPRVDSCLVHLRRRKKPPVEVRDEQLLFKIVKAAFGQRRKILLNSLLTVEPTLTKPRLHDILLKAAINPSQRGEELSLEQFAALANCWQV